MIISTKKWFYLCLIGLPKEKIYAARVKSRITFEWSLRNRNVFCIFCICVFVYFLLIIIKYSSFIYFNLRACWNDSHKLVACCFVCIESKMRTENSLNLKLIRLWMFYNYINYVNLIRNSAHKHTNSTCLCLCVCVVERAKERRKIK